MLIGLQINWNFPTLLMGTGTLESGLAVLTKLNIILNTYSAIVLLGIYPLKMKTELLLYF
jgi:hypothetical protein